MLKRIVSIILIMTMLVTMSFHSYAFAETKGDSYRENKRCINNIIIDDLSENQNKQIETDLSDFVSWGFNDKSFTSIEASDEGGIIYSIESPLEATIEVDQSSDHKTYSISEGSKSDVVTIYDNGELYLDGNKVVVTEYNAIEPQAAGIVYSNTTSCPAGKSGDYTKKKGTTKNANVALSKTLGSITIAGLTVVIGLISWQVGIAAVAAQSINQIVDASNSDSKGLSYKATMYYHKNSNGGWIGGKLVTKYVTTWYTKKNYKGRSTKKTTYRYGVSG